MPTNIVAVPAFEIQVDDILVCADKNRWIVTNTRPNPRTGERTIEACRVYADRPTPDPLAEQARITVLRSVTIPTERR